MAWPVMADQDAFARLVMPCFEIKLNWPTTARWNSYRWPGIRIQGIMAWAHIHFYHRSPLFKGTIKFVFTGAFGVGDDGPTSSFGTTILQELLRPSSHGVPTASSALRMTKIVLMLHVVGLVIKSGFACPWWALLPFSPLVPISREANIAPGFWFACWEL